jgi:hypothetical protein
VSSAAGLIRPDPARLSHGNPDIDSLRVVFVELDDDAATSSCCGCDVFEAAPTPQNISTVGVVVPVTEVAVTIGGDDFPVARRGRCGQESDGASDERDERALLRPEGFERDGDDETGCVFCCRFSLLDDEKLVENIELYG